MKYKVEEIVKNQTEMAEHFLNTIMEKENDNISQIVKQRFNDFDRGFSAAFEVIHNLISDDNFSAEEIIAVLKNYKNMKGYNHEEGENGFIKHKTSG